MSRPLPPLVAFAKALVPVVQTFPVAVGAVVPRAEPYATDPHSRAFRADLQKVNLEGSLSGVLKQRIAKAKPADQTHPELIALVKEVQQRPGESQAPFRFANRTFQGKPVYFAVRETPNRWAPNEVDIDVFAATQAGLAFRAGATDPVTPPRRASKA